MKVKRVGKYEIGKTLGEGTFGKVKSAVNTETGETVAIKILDKEKIQKQNMGNQIKKEISIMKLVRHKHVVALKEVLASKTKIFIVLEVVTGGELFDKIVAEGRFDETLARYYFRQLISGVEYCHRNGVCHRDLKPENLLLDENSDLKISDFGLSALYAGDAGASRQELLHTTCGTPNYVAPEVLADQGYDGRMADVWSCGVILYVLVAGFLPFDEPTMTALFRKIQAADFSYPRWFSAELRGLLDKILVADPKQRLTLQQVKREGWVQHGGGFDDDDDGAVVAATNEPAITDTTASATGSASASASASASGPKSARTAKKEGAGGAGDATSPSSGRNRRPSSAGAAGAGAASTTTTTEAEAERISNAVGEVPEDEVKATGTKARAGVPMAAGLMADDDEDEDDMMGDEEGGGGANGEGGGGEGGSGGIRYLNALDVIHGQFGAIQKMVQTGGPGGSGGGGSGGSGAAASGAGKRKAQFTSNLTPQQLLRDVVGQLMDVGGCECSTAGAKVKVQKMTSKGMISVLLQVYGLTDDMSLLEITRGKGDILEYHAFYRDLVEQRLGKNNIINIPPPPASGGASGGGAAPGSGRKSK